MISTTPPRIVSIDYGTKRVGLAMADPLRMFAQPIGAVTPDEAVTKLQQVHNDERIAIIVIGWPLMEDGEEGNATQRVQQYINRLRKKLPHVEFVKWDERYTSLLAKEQLKEVGGSRKRRREKGRVDAMAASIILQEYLDQL